MYKLKSYALATAFVFFLSALPAMAESQARIVRLSDVQGRVQIDKNAGLGFENAFANLPITQGTQLRTMENGRAEIEFEDGSTLRVTPKTTVRFSTLASSDAGKRTSVVDLVEGKAYVNWLGKGGEQLTLNFSGERLELAQASHLRLTTSSSMSEVANFKNEIEVLGPSGTTRIGKKKMATFDTENHDSATLASNIEADPYDQWDKQATEYHDQYSKNNRSPFGYGYSDLSYYGGYSNVAGYGTLWQPYFAGAGWNPYMDGAWSWYPGMGFMWASAYPWGWMPYYYGNWAFVPNFGWGWQPGAGTTWHGGIHYVGAAASFHPPAVPSGTVSTVAVGRGGPPATNSPAMHTLVTNGSAGLSIPRGAISSLHQLNRQVAKTGAVQLRTVPAFAASSRASVYGYSSPAHTAGSVGHAGMAPAGHASSGAGHPAH
jgi:hypothetical protein